MDDNYRIQRFRNANEVHRMGPGEVPPAIGWAVGPDGLFFDGAKISDEGELTIGVPGSPGFYELRYIPLDPGASA